MSIEGDQPSLLRRSLFRRGEAARGELVWSADGPKVVAKVISAEEMASTPAVDQPAADVVTVPASPSPADADVAASGAPVVADSAEIATLRAQALERLEAALRGEALERLEGELRARRAELEKTLERERIASEGRIATAERLEQEALAHRREEIDRWSERWAAEQHRMLAERIEAALSAELGEVKLRYQGAESRIAQQIEARRREEAARLEAWRASERDRIEAELAADQERFNDRLLQQLKDFEFQLGERQREQEARIARWWEAAGGVARQRVAEIIDEALRPAP